MKKIIIVGANGQLGNEFQVLSTNYQDHQFFFYDKQQLNIVDKEEVEKVIAQIKPDYLVNCAAYTAVDKAETDKELAHSINHEAVDYLAATCVEHNVRFIHTSTDYVFNGAATKPYKEDDLTNPTTIYGATKLEGERAAIKYGDAIVIRTAWVYSIYGNNFVKTMLRMMKTKESLNVVADQYGTPTYAADLAEATMQIITSGKWLPGIYHFTNDGIITWFDFAMQIKKLSGLSCIVNPITTAEYPTTAKRPQYSVLDKSKIQSAYGIKLKDWKQSLQEFFSLLLSGN